MIQPGGGPTFPAVASHRVDLRPVLTLSSEPTCCCRDAKAVPAVAFPGYVGRGQDSHHPQWNADSGPR